MQGIVSVTISERKWDVRTSIVPAFKDQVSTSLSKENEKRTPLSDELNFEVLLAIEKN
jgi:hypothetical protein